MSELKEIDGRPVFEVPQSHPLSFTDAEPVRVRLDECGMSVILESPFGGHRAGNPHYRVEAHFSRFEWPQIVEAVEAAFKQAEERAIEHNKLDDMYYGDDP